MRTLWWIVIVIVLVIAGRRLYRWWRPVTHSFWNKQPVSRDYAKQGIVSTEKQPALDPIDTTLSVVALYTDTLRSREQLSNFLRHHFIRGYQYSTDFLNWAVGTGNAAHCFKIEKTHYRNDSMQVSPLLGSISVKDIPLVIAGQPLRMGYVDYLAVHSGHRNKRLAPTLISHVAAIETYETFIFKIEDTPLPFETACSFRYYSYFHDNTAPDWTLPQGFRVLPLDEGLLSVTRDYLADKSRGFTLYADYSEEEFGYWFLPRDGVVSSWVVLDTKADGDMRMVGFWSYYHYASESPFHKEPLPMCEVTLFVAETTQIVTVAQQMILESYRQKIGCLVCPDIGYNADFVHELNFIQNKACHYQLYNYGVGRSLEPREVLWNPV